MPGLLDRMKQSGAPHDILNDVEMLLKQSDRLLRRNAELSEHIQKMMVEVAYIKIKTRNKDHG